MAIPHNKRKSTRVAASSVRQRVNIGSELSVEQRRVIDRSIAKGLEDLRMGRVYGPFDTAEEIAASIETEVEKRKSRKKPARSG
jgi:hypothetical protein